MTPKEKAQELVLKYLGLQEPNYNWFNKTLAKQCALIAVDEIMPIVKGYEDALSASQTSDELEYWQEVKQEIEKL